MSEAGADDPLVPPAPDVGSTEAAAPAADAQAAGTQPADAPAAGALPERTLPLEFRATGREYFRIWIVNLLLSILTLGIYSAWAKVRRLRYFYGSTSLDGSAFDYHGRPLAILKGRLIAFSAYIAVTLLSQLYPIAGILFLPLFAAGLPWVVYRSQRFQMRMTSYRGLRFGFHGTLGGAAGAYIGWAIAAALTLYLLMPTWLWKRIGYLLGNCAWGSERFRFTAPLGRYYRFCIAVLGLALALLVVPIVALGTYTTMQARAAGAPSAGPPGILQGLGFLLLPVAALAVAAYFRKSLLNASFGSLEIGPHSLRTSIRYWPLLRLYVTNLLLIALTLGLYYPWARVRLAQYQLANTRVIVRGNLDDATAAGTVAGDAVGEEIGDFFDVDFGL